MIDRTQTILHQLFLNKVTAEKTLLKKLELTPRQLTYAIAAINDELETLGYSKIVKKDGHFHYSPQTKQLLLNHVRLSEMKISSDARIRILLLLILSKEEYISLDHFVYVFSLSKNTILSELKKCKEYLKEYNLTLEYSRKTGYDLAGEEWDKRRLLHHVIHDINQSYGKEFVFELLNEYSMKLQQVHDQLHQLEGFLEMKYSDDDYYQLIPFITVVLHRIQTGNQITLFDQKDIAEIKTTKEYQSLLYLSDFPKIPENEMLYISLHLLSSNMSIHPPLNETDLYDLSRCLSDFLEEFEQRALLIFQDKNELLDKLLNHFKPAYYRIKYHLTFENVMHEQIVSKYQVLHNFVKQSITPLEKFFHTTLPDKEISYITLFIGGHLLDKGESRFEEKTIKAVIVCPNGISFSKLMEQDLKRLFPEFVFYQTMSIREYEGFILPHDLVFSSVPLETKKTLYLVNTLTMDQEKKVLRQTVIGQLFGIQSQSIDIDTLLQIITKHAAVKSLSALRDDLNRYLVAPNHQQESPIESRVVTEDAFQLFTDDCIQIIAGRLSWEDILKKACQPLVEKGIVDKQYVQALISTYAAKPEYIMLRGQLLLPHLDPTMYKQKLAMSLVVVKEGVLYQGKLIHLIVVMTTPDKTSHLPYLLELRNLAKNTKLIREIVQSDTTLEIREHLQKGC